MPKESSIDVPHSASANHRVPRHEGERIPFIAKPWSVQHDKRHAVIFYRELLDAEERAEVERERGIALCREGAGGAREALALLETALAARSDDVAAWESKGHALAGLGRHDEALAAHEMALTLEPTRESALAEAARVAAKMGRRQVAIDYWKRTIAVNPWRSDYHGELAFVYFYNRDWQASADACRQALRLNSLGVSVRKLLVQCYLNLGNTEAARGELETILGFDLPDRADLLRSFSLQAGPGGRPK
jgi:tetratricopeptide (TPR) repeat protein